MCADLSPLKVSDVRQAGPTHMRAQSCHVKNPPLPEIIGPNFHKHEQISLCAHFVNFKVTTGHRMRTVVSVLLVCCVFVTGGKPACVCLCLCACVRVCAFVCACACVRACAGRCSHDTIADTTFSERNKSFFTLIQLNFEKEGKKLWSPGKALPKVFAVFSPPQSRFNAH